MHRAVKRSESIQFAFKSSCSRSNVQFPGNVVGQSVPDVRRDLCEAALSEPSYSHSRNVEQATAGRHELCDARLSHGGPRFNAR